MTRLRDRLLASDPPLERFRFAARTLIALVLCGLPLLVLTRLHLLNGSTAVLGVLVAVMATFQANDTAPRARKLTGALLALPAAFAVSATAVLDAIHPVAGDIGFLAIAFPAVWVRRYGPRGFGLGMMAIITAFFALFLQLEPPMIPSAMVVICLGTVAAWIAHFLILPDSPHLALTTARAAFESRLLLVEEAIQATRDDDTPGTIDALRDHLVALDAAAVTIDQLIAGNAFVLDAGTRTAIRVALLEAEVEAGAVAREQTAEPPAAACVTLAATRARVHAALQTAIDAPADGAADAPISSGPKPPDIGGMKPSTRQAFQLTTASALAMAIGTAIPPHQYAWALLTAFIVYAGAASAAEARRRAFARAVGTAAGVAVGLVAVEFVKQHAPLELTLAFAGLFIAMYLFRVSYVAFTFFITVTIAMIYDVVGRPTDELLLARLIETIVGTICGAAAATLIVPLRTAAVVGTLGNGLAQALGRNATPAEDTQTLENTRDLDAKLNEFLARARPLLEPASGATLETIEAQAAIVDCVARARAYALERATHTGAGSSAKGIEPAARRLATLFADGNETATLDWHAIAVTAGEIATGYVAGTVPSCGPAAKLTLPKSDRSLLKEHSI